MAKTLFATLALMLVVAYAHAEYDVGKYCQLVQKNTKLPSLTSCQTFYVCQGSNQYMTLYCPSGTYFDKNTQSCESSSDGCSNGVLNPCLNHDSVFVRDTVYCNEWHYCLQNAIVNSGDCPQGQIFSYEEQSCVYGQCSGNSIGGNNNNIINSNNNEICQIMPEGQFFGDFQNCSNWHKCVNMQEKSGHCLNDLVYDTVSGMCLTKTSTMCQRIDGGDVVDGPSGAPTGDCTANSVVGDKNVCSIYYTCSSDSKWTQQQCPQQQYFDVISGQCNSTQLARAYTGCNRCQYTSGSLYWANAVNSSCSTYLTCKNGQESTANVGDCGTGNFFNEDLQSCMIGNVTLGQYSANHGACQDYSCDNTTQVCTLIDNSSSGSNGGSNGGNSGTTESGSTGSTTESSSASTGTNTGSTASSSASTGTNTGSSSSSSASTGADSSSSTSSTTPTPTSTDSTTSTTPAASSPTA